MVKMKIWLFDFIRKTFSMQYIIYCIFSFYLASISNFYKNSIPSYFTSPMNWSSSRIFPSMVKTRNWNYFLLGSPMTHRRFITCYERFHFSWCLILFSLGCNNYLVLCFWNEFERRITSTFIESTFHIVHKVGD